ncbi:MAG: SPOR domain-containing protein [Alphaproteobacteria bacterium]
MAKPYGLMVGVVFSAFALSGCVLPAAVSIASFAFDGASYVATGKSVQDHAISMVADEDCALWRVVAGRSICVEKSETTIAALPVQPPQRTRDGVSEPTGLEASAPDRTATAPEEGERPASAAVAASEESSPAAEAPVELAAAEEPAREGRTVGVVETDALVVEETASIQWAELPRNGPLTGGGETFDGALSTDATDDPPRPRLAVAATNPNAKVEAQRILAAKAAGVGPFALAPDGAWRPLGAPEPQGLAAAFDGALGSGKASSVRLPTSTVEARSVYLVFGTFADSSKADIAVRRYADFTTHVWRDSRGGRRLYRVVTGPYAAGEAHAALSAAARSGAPHVWLLQF